MTAPQTYEQTSEPVGEMTDQLLQEQLPQVKYIARRIHERLPQHVPLDDLVHAGIVGLIDAAHKFNPDKQVRFASYAKFRIRGAILDSLRDMDWSPRDLRRKARRLEATTQKLQTELGRSATEPELAAAMEMTLEGISASARRNPRPRGRQPADRFAGRWARNRPWGKSSGTGQPGPPVSVHAGRASAIAGRCDFTIAQARTAGARPLLPGGTHHEGGGRGVGSGRIARLADSLHSGGAAPR
jgi:RNA polymerase sigma factor (sigma-70 family)